MCYRGMDQLLRQAGEGSSDGSASRAVRLQAGHLTSRSVSGLAGRQLNSTLKGGRFRDARKKEEKALEKWISTSCPDLLLRCRRQSGEVAKAEDVQS